MMGDSRLFCWLFAGWRCNCQRRHSDHIIVHHKWELSWLCARSCSKVPIAPWDFHVFCARVCRAAVQSSLMAQWPSHRAPSAGTQLALCALVFKSSHRPDGIFTSFALCLQGGGVFVQSGTVTISSCTISGNTAYYVRAHAQEFPLPRWEDC
jgi:hypothetical protein